MSREPRVTVLMPCYNAELYLVEAIESIINQTYRNLEILLIDDGSKDATRDMIENYAIKDSRIIPVYNERNLGLIRTLNKGVKLASGEFIARMDADDISVLNRIEKMIEVFLEHPEIDVMSASYFHISPLGKVLRRNFPKATTSKALQFVSFFCTPVIHPCVIAKTSVLKANAFDEEYIHSEDYEIFSRLLMNGYNFLNLMEPLYYLRMNTLSVSYKFERIQISTHTRISQRNIENYFGAKFDFFLHKVMINRISFSVSFSMLNEAIKTLQNLKMQFLEREKPEATEINQIEEFLTEQFIDIYFQSLKSADWYYKPIIVLTILINIKTFLSRRGRQYMRSKLSFLPVQED